MHGIKISPNKQIFVADRENDRIQIFSLEGQLLEIWPHVQRPTDIAFGGDGLVYVSKLWWRVGQTSFTHDPIKYDLPSRMSIFDLKRNVMNR